jgi:hypothetical protein
MPPTRKNSSLDKPLHISTEIDLMSTYVGGGRGCIQAIVEHRQLEAAAVESSDGIAADTDTINPSVHEPPAPTGAHGRRRGRLSQR